jgi:hypothetical protein
MYKRRNVSLTSHANADLGQRVTCWRSVAQEQAKQTSGQVEQRDAANERRDEHERRRYNAAGLLIENSNSNQLLSSINWNEF